MKYELGARVRILGTARKVRDHHRGGIKVSHQEGRLPTRYDYGNPKVFTEGIIVGQRTVASGFAEFDDGAVFSPAVGTARNVWLVAFDMRMKPAMCFDHQVEAL